MTARKTRRSAEIRAQCRISGSSRKSRTEASLADGLSLYVELSDSGIERRARYAELGGSAAWARNLAIAVGQRPFDDFLFITLEGGRETDQLRTGGPRSTATPVQRRTCRRCRGSPLARRYSAARGYCPASDRTHRGRACSCRSCGCASWPSPHSASRSTPPASGCLLSVAGGAASQSETHSAGRTGRREMCLRQSPRPGRGWLPR